MLVYPGAMLIVIFKYYGSLNFKLKLKFQFLMILKNDVPKTYSYTKMLLYSLQHFKALQLHIKIITVITKM